ncbi:hypothetical protein ACWEFL_33505 [Streptomyces sp. NPDC004838]
MTGGGYGSYEADPVRLAAFISETREMGKEFQGLADAFSQAVEPTHRFYGITGVHDDYADEMEPRVDGERDYVIECLGQISTAFTGITEGHFQELRNIKSTQGQIMDDIGSLGGGLEAPGEGGGKH